MEGLVQETNRHAFDTLVDPEPRDLEIIAQYQRMSHDGLASRNSYGLWRVFGLTYDAKRRERSSKTFIAREAIQASLRRMPKKRSRATTIWGQSVLAHQLPRIPPIAAGGAETTGALPAL
jgi:hypothetical protein